MVNSLSNVVKQTAKLTNVNISFQFFSQHRRKSRNFHRVEQCVLAVACAELQSTKNLNEFWIQRCCRQTKFEESIFASLANVYLKIALRLVNKLFDTSRMNTSVDDQLLKRTSRNLSTNRGEARNRYGARSIVD